MPNDRTCPFIAGARVKRIRSLRPREEGGGKKWYENWFAQMEQTNDHRGEMTDLEQCLLREHALVEV